MAEDKAAEQAKLAEQTKKKVDSLKKQLERDEKKLGAGKTDTHLRLVRKQLRKHQRAHRHLTGRDKPKEGDDKK